MIEPFLFGLVVGAAFFAAIDLYYRDRSLESAGQGPSQAEIAEAQYQHHLSGLREKCR